MWRTSQIQLLVIIKKNYHFGLSSWIKIMYTKNSKTDKTQKGQTDRTHVCDVTVLYFIQFDKPKW